MVAKQKDLEEQERQVSGWVGAAHAAAGCGGAQAPLGSGWPFLAAWLAGEGPQPGLAYSLAVA